jgi:hypothetical protein
MQPTRHTIFILQIHLFANYYLFRSYRPPSGKHSRYCWKDRKSFRPSITIKTVTPQDICRQIKSSLNIIRFCSIIGCHS